jgi:hypothetical protein
MKTWVGIFLAMATLTAGCAPGYYAKTPAYPEEVAADQQIGKGYENPETAEERTQRIWSEGAGR